MSRKTKHAGYTDECRLWAQSRMLDVVQQSFEDRDIDRTEVLRVAALSMLLTASDDIYKFFAAHDDDVMRVCDTPTPI